MRSGSVFRVVLLVRRKKLTMFSILSNENMEVGRNIHFDYFMNVFKIHFGAICHSAITAVNFHDKDGSFPCKMVCKVKMRTNESHSLYTPIINKQTDPHNSSTTLNLK